MNYFIKNIHVNELFHLKNFDIPIADEQAPHLMITGKNGSGKTVLLNAIADFLERIKDDKTLDFTKYEVNLNYLKRRLDDGVKDDKELMSVKNGIDFYEMKFNTLYGKVKLDFVNVVDIINAYKEGNFIIAFYQAARKPEMIEPESPTKPTYDIKGAVK